MGVSNFQNVKFSKCNTELLVLKGFIAVNSLQYASFPQVFR